VGVRIADVSIPASPTLVTTIDTPGITLAVAVEQPYLYVAEGPSGFEIYLIHDIFADGFESGDTAAWREIGG
jgi:hypothetical protein